MPKRQTTITFAVIVALVLIVTASSLASHKATSTTTTPTSIASTPTTTSTATTGSSTTSTVSTSSYKDGSYTEEGSYTSPGGQEKIKISLTIKDGVVTATSAANEATDGEGKQYQDDFIAGYPSLVVGKSLDSISLSRVSGSSLTSKGFNEALTQIKADAKA